MSNKPRNWTGKIYGKLKVVRISERGTATGNTYGGASVHVAMNEKSQATAYLTKLKKTLLNAPSVQENLNSKIWKIKASQLLTRKVLIFQLKIAL